MRIIKRLKRVAIMLVAGFFAFAPPGTLIFAAALALGLLGKFWLLAGLCCLVALAGVWLLLRRRAARGRSASELSARPK